MRKDALIRLLNDYKQQGKNKHSDIRIKLLDEFLATECLLYSDDRPILFSDFINYLATHPKYTTLFDQTYFASKEPSKELFTIFMLNGYENVLHLYPVKKSLASYLTYKDLANLGSCSKTYYADCISYTVWKRKLVAAGYQIQTIHEAMATKTICNYAMLYKALKTYRTYTAQLWEVLLLSGEIPAIKYCIKHLNISSSSKTQHGFNALDLAAISGSIIGMKYIIQHLQIAPSNKTLWFAAYRGRIDTVNYVIDELKIPIDAHDNKKLNALYYAIGGNCVNMMRHLQTRGIKPLKNAEKENCLHIAAAHGNIAAANFAITKMHINPFSKNKYGENAFLIAGKCLRLEFAISLLTQHGYTKYWHCANDKKATFLHLVCREGNKDIIAFAIYSLKIAVDCKDIYGATPIHYAAAYGNFEAAQYLLENHKIDLNSKTKAGATILHSATQADNPKLIEYLLDKTKINVDYRDNKGRTPLHHSLFYGNANTSRKLIKHGADVNLTDYYGQDTLFFAEKNIKANKDEIVNMLVEYQQRNRNQHH